MCDLLERLVFTFFDVFYILQYSTYVSNLSTAFQHLLPYFALWKFNDFEF